MKKSLKIVGISFAAIFLLLGGVVFYASTKISTEEIHKYTVESLRKTFPNANVELGKLDLGFGASIYVKAASLQISSKDTNENIFSFNDVKLKIPVLALLTNGGTLELDIASPKVFYKEIGLKNNIQLALPSEIEKTEVKQDSTPVKNETSDSGNIKLPSSISNSKFNINVRDIQITYQLKDNSKGEIQVGKFLIKNLNLTSSSAFELSSKIKAKMHDGSTFDTTSVLIGEFNIADYLSKGEVEVKSMLQLSETSFSKFKSNLPDVKSDVKFIYKKDGSITGKTTTTLNSSSSITCSFEVSKESMNVNDLNAKFKLADFSGFISEMSPETQVGGSEFLIEGKINTKKGEKLDINPQISFKLNPEITYTKDKMTAQVTMSGSINGTKFEAVKDVKTFGGLIRAKVDGKIDINNYKVLTDLGPFNVDVSVNDLNFPAEFIRETIYGKPKDKSETADSAKPNTSVDVTDSKVPEVKPMILPVVNTKLSINRIKIADQELNGKGTITVSGQTINVKPIELAYSKGTARINSTISLGKTIENNFEFNLKNLDLKGIKGILPPTLESVSGIFNGDVKGKLSLAKTLDYNVSIKVNAEKGELQKIKVGEYLKEVVSGVSLLKDHADKVAGYNLDGKFDKFTFQGVVTPKVYQIEKFNFVAANNLAVIDGHGKIEPLSTTETSIMEIMFKDTSGKLLKGGTAKYVGDTIPVRLVGAGMVLKPDYTYTVAQLTKSATSKVKDEAISKAKDKVKEEGKKLLDKVLNKDGAQGQDSPVSKGVNKLLKGFFK